MLSPKAGKVYRDDIGRLLTVTEVRPGDRLGRDVVGFITRPRVITEDGVIKRTYSEPANYSCTASVFQATWKAEVE